jgi:hypothetical protein
MADVAERHEASQSTGQDAESREFKDLMAAKNIFIVPAFCFCCLLLALPGWSATRQN